MSDQNQFQLPGSQLHHHDKLVGLETWLSSCGALRVSQPHLSQSDFVFRSLPMTCGNHHLNSKITYLCKSFLNGPWLPHLNS